MTSILRKLTRAVAPTALGLGLAALANPLSAAVEWSLPYTLFEDDNVIFHFKGPGSEPNVLEIGDVLVATFEYEKTAGVDVAPDELTAVSVIEVAAFADLDGVGGNNDIIFAPASAGFDAYSGADPLPNGLGGPGGTGMVSFYLDATPNLAVSAGDISNGTPSCTTYADCTAQATDGALYLVAGLSGDFDESWVSLNAPRDDTNVINIADPVLEFAQFNTGLAILVNNTGQILGSNTVQCGAFCGPGGDGMVDVFTSGSVKGGGEDLIASEWFGTGDIDTSFAVEQPADPLGCRFTGGLVDIAEFSADDALNNRYTGGGQVGANTGQQPQPKGEWTHHQQRGPAGAFTFHGGTASAPEGTEIDAIRCSDPGGCAPSGDPPSPIKQLDFDGIGTFSNIGKGSKAPDFVATATVTAEGNGNKTFDGTFHWFEVNIDDLGEPGNKGDENSAQCPATGFGEKGATELGACDCSDFYRITIYDGVDAADVVKNADGSIDASQLNRTDVIYEVWGYIDGGNLQLHYPTGFDAK